MHICILHADKGNRNVKRKATLYSTCSSLAPLLITILGHIYTYTVKILKIGTPEIITIIVLRLEQLDFTVQHGVQKMQTE